MDFKKKLEDARTVDPTSMKARIDNAIKGKPKGGTVTTVPLADPRVSSAHQEALVQLDNASARVADVAEIHNEIAFKEADVFLGEIKAIKDRWTIGTDKVPGIDRIIEPIRKGLDGLYALRRGIIVPLEELEAKVKGAMNRYQLALKRKRDEEDRLKLEAAAEERRKAEELRRKAEQARTPQMAQRYQQQALKQEVVAEQIEEIETTSLAQGDNSHSRSGKKWKLDDTQEFIKGLASGVIPWDCLSSITVSFKQMNAYYKDDPATVAQWPGIIEEDFVNTVHGKGRGGFGQ